MEDLGKGKRQITKDHKWELSEDVKLDHAIGQIEKMINQVTTRVNQAVKDIVHAESATPAP